MSIAVNTDSRVRYSGREYIATVTASDTVADGFYGTIIMNVTATATLTLATAANNNERKVTVINIASATLTVSDGATIVTLARLESATFECNAVDWYLVSVYGRVLLPNPEYKDINISGSLLAKPTSSNPDIVNFVDKNGADTTIPTYAFGVDEYVSGGFELQHDYKEGTDLVFHVHFQIIAAPSGTDNVQWRLDYILLRGGVVLEPKVTIDSPDTAVTTQYSSYRSDFTAITGTTFKIGDQFMFNLWRVAATGDAFAGDALIQTAGIHYAVNTLGSRLIGTK